MEVVTTAVVNAFRCAAPTIFPAEQGVYCTLYPHSHPEYYLPEFHEMFGARQFYSIVRSTSLQYHFKAFIRVETLACSCISWPHLTRLPFSRAVFNDYNSSLSFSSCATVFSFTTEMRRKSRNFILQKLTYSNIKSFYHSSFFLFNIVSSRTFWSIHIVIISLPRRHVCYK